jgi:hypothetical protein
LPGETRPSRSIAKVAHGTGQTATEDEAQSAYEKELRKLQVRLPKRSLKGCYNDQAGLHGMKFVAQRY